MQQLAPREDKFEVEVTFVIHKYYTHYMVPFHILQIEYWAGTVYRSILRTVGEPLVGLPSEIASFGLRLFVRRAQPQLVLDQLRSLGLREVVLKLFFVVELRGRPHRCRRLYEPSAFVLLLRPIEGTRLVRFCR